MKLKIDDKVICIKDYLNAFKAGQMFKIDNVSSMFYKSDRPCNFYLIKDLWFIDSEKGEFSFNIYFETLNKNRSKKIAKLNKL